MSVREYGCVKCQKWHADRDPDGLFEAHKWFQSKHGIRSISERRYAFGRLVSDDSPVANYVDAVRALNRRPHERG